MRQKPVLIVHAIQRWNWCEIRLCFHNKLHQVNRNSFNPELQISFRVKTGLTWLGFQHKRLSNKLETIYQRITYYLCQPVYSFLTRVWKHDHAVSGEPGACWKSGMDK